jgi:hypothetical protein
MARHIKLSIHPFQTRTIRMINLIKGKGRRRRGKSKNLTEKMGIAAHIFKCPHRRISKHKFRKRKQRKAILT